MTDPTPTPTPAPARLWMRFLLPLSLMLNLIMIGFLVGAVVKGPPRDMGARETGFGFLANALTREDRRVLRQAFVASGGGPRSDDVARQQDLQTMVALLRADPMDRAALQALLDQGAERAAQRQQLGRMLFLDHLAAMTPQTRRAFADRLEAGRGRRRDRE